MNTEILENIGLSKNEIKVYFALLEFDQSSATPIVKKANIPNSKVYPILEKLIKKGLVSYVIKNNVKYFQASDPKHLIDILTNKEKEIAIQKEEIEKIIPQIELKKRLSIDNQEATVYEGFEGVKIAFKTILNTLNKGEEYYVFMLGETLKEKEVIRHFNWFHKQRIIKKIKAKLISESKHKEIVKRWHGYKEMKFKYTSQKLPVGTFIFKNHVMTIIWGDKPSAFIIKSKINYNFYKEFFEDMWKIANP